MERLGQIPKELFDDFTKKIETNKETSVGTRAGTPRQTCEGTLGRNC